MLLLLNQHSQIMLKLEDILLLNNLLIIKHSLWDMNNFQLLLIHSKFKIDTLNHLFLFLKIKSQDINYQNKLLVV